VHVLLPLQKLDPTLRKDVSDVIVFGSDGHCQLREADRVFLVEDDRTHQDGQVDPAGVVDGVQVDVDVGQQGRL
jgi:hypothetical protein